MFIWTNTTTSDWFRLYTDANGFRYDAYDSSGPHNLEFINFDITNDQIILYQKQKLYSGADFQMYSDAGTTEVMSIDGATGNMQIDGTFTLNDIVLTRAAANILRIQPGGTNYIQLRLHPSSTEDASNIYITNDSDTTNWASMALTVDGADAKIQYSTSGTGFTPITNLELVGFPTINMNDATVDNINLGDASANVNIKAVEFDSHTHSGAAGHGSQLDWDTCWSDAVHSHATDGEGGIITATNIDGGNHKMFYTDGSGNVTELSHGATAGHVLTSQGATSPPQWAAGSGGEDSVARALAMYGSSNKAWVTCVWAGSGTPAKVDAGNAGWRNTDGTNTVWMWTLPLPPVKGSYKLYISNVAIDIQDADTLAYVDRVRVFGTDYTGATTVYDDAAASLTTTGRKNSGDEIDAWGAADDMSGYRAVQVALNVVVDVAAELDIMAVQLECYYTT